MAAANLAVRGMGKFCSRGGYRLRSIVSVQAEEGVKIQAEQPNKGGMQREDWGEGRGRKCVGLVTEGGHGLKLGDPGHVHDPTPAKIYPGAM